MNDSSRSPVGEYPPLVVDMHAHYPMRWMPAFYWNGFALLGVALFGGSARAARLKFEQLNLSEAVTALERYQVLEARERWHILSNRMKAIIIALANIFLNYASPCAGAAISPERMRKGGVRIAFSVLLDTFDELFDGYPKWPTGTPSDHLLQLIGFVERQVTERADEDRVWIPKWDQLDVAINEARTGGRIALIHCVEGGYHLGDKEGDITTQVEYLKTRGVTYVTLAHLLFRRLATSANAFPIPDWLYHLRYPERTVGLTELGKHAVRQLAQKRILIDVCHMSELAICDTLRVLDEFDTQRPSEPRTPVIATHMACRIGKAEYNLSDDTIKSIIARKGLLGVIFSRHWMREHLNTVDDNWEDTRQVVKAHLERIRDKGDPELHCAAIGSDHDGFIRTALHGLEHPGKMLEFSSWIQENYPTQAEGILSGNAIRVLRQVWQQP